MIGSIDYNKRLANLSADVLARQLDSFLVTSETNVSYLSGFSGHDSVLLVTPKKKFFLTDSRYIEEVEKSVKGFEIELVEHSTYDTLKTLIAKNKLKKVGIESMNLPYGVAVRLKSLVAKTRLLPIKDLVERLRAVKDKSEIALIKNSIRLTKKVFEKIKIFIKPGVSENFIARTLEVEFIRSGGRPSFELIVASGENSSKPHARPTDRKIEKNDFLMIDIGCNLNGYNSDLTRMVMLGKIKDKFKKIYGIVKAAQDIAMKKIAPGRKIAKIDLAARGYIQKHGFGKHFGHSLGHGIGLDVHEEPSISKINETVLKPGMVFTVEPAIYIPKFGGVRIEDMVLVTERGCEVLT